MSKIYFDYASTTPVDEGVLNTYVNIEQKMYQNQQSSVDINNLLDQGKEKILDNLKVKDYEVIFTSGGTEANNLAILGKFKNQENKKHFITTTYEHHSVLETFLELERLGHEVSYVKPQKDGTILKKDVINLINDNTALISIMAHNNEIGTANNINDIFKEVKEMKNSILTMSDFIQALGKYEISLEYVDLATFSAHKVYGLKGIGMLIKKKNIVMEQIIYGSKTSIRPGTMSVGAMITFVKVFLEANNECLNRQKEIIKIQDYFLSLLCNEIELNVKGLGVLSLSLKIEALAQTIVEYLYEKDIIISTKSSCAQKLNKPSHVLESIGLSKEKIDRTIRVSFSNKTKRDDVKYLAKVLNEAINIF